MSTFELGTSVLSRFSEPSVAVVAATRRRLDHRELKFLLDAVDAIQTHPQAVSDRELPVAALADNLACVVVILSDRRRVCPYTTTPTFWGWSRHRPKRLAESK